MIDKHQTPLVSVLMRNYNEKHALERTLAMLERQNYCNWELIACDSGSNDGSLELLKKSVAQLVLHVKKQNYTPGKVLNEMVKESRGEIVVFNNADCIPLDHNWLGNLISPLIYSSKAYSSTFPRPPGPLATFAQQLGHCKLRVSLQHDLLRCYGDGKIHRHWFHFFSLASSATFRKTALETPFNLELKYCEDLDWSYRLCKTGKRKRNEDSCHSYFKNKLYYAKDSKVLHDHNYSHRQLATRRRGEGYAMKKIFPNKHNIVKMVFKLPLFLAKHLLGDLIFLFSIDKNLDYQKKNYCGVLLDIVAFRVVASLSFLCGAICAKLDKKVMENEKSFDSF